MTTRYLLGLIMLFAIIFIVGWELYAFIFSPDATISVFMTDLSEFSPLFSHSFTALFGILIGHFFIPAKGSGRKGI